MQARKLCLHERSANAKRERLLAMLLAVLTAVLLEGAAQVLEPPLVGMGLEMGLGSSP